MSALDDVPLDSPAIALEVSEIEESLQETGKGQFRDIFRNGSARFANRAFIAAATQCFQQMGGINAIAFYQKTIFRTFLGMSSETASILSATVFTWQTLCAPIGAFTIERVGRRKLMIFGAVGMGMCMAIIAGCTSHPSNHMAVHAAIAFVYLFSLAFVTGYLGLAFLYSSEIAPLSVRTPITALSTTSTWVFNFTVVEATPTGFDSLGYKYFIIYAVINWFLILPSKSSSFTPTLPLTLHVPTNPPHFKTLTRNYSGVLPLPRDPRPPSRIRRSNLPGQQKHFPTGSCGENITRECRYWRTWGCTCR